MFRSLSGPSLSISTSTANTLPASGQSSLPPPSAGKSVFGNLNTTQPQQGTSLFGNSTATSQPQQSNSLFGSSTAASQPQQGSSLFGTSSSQPFASQPQQSGGLFGSQPSQAIGGGLFSTQPSQQPSQNSFGVSNAQQVQNTSTGGLFGSSSGPSLAQNQPQPTQGNSLFGGSFNTQNKNSLFGNTQTQNQTQNQQATMQPPPQRSIFSGTIGQQSHQQEVVPGVRISVNELRPTTRFNDLHEELQKAIEDVDKFILNQIHLQEQCDSANDRIDTLCQEMPPDVEYCTKILDTVQRALENDAESIAFAKGLVRADATDAKLSFKVIQNLKLPQQFHHTNLWNSASTVTISPEYSDGDVPEGQNRNLVEYFSKQADNMSNTLNTYKRNIGEVEAYLHGIESNIMQQMQQVSLTRAHNGGEKNVDGQIRELAAVLREFESGILGIATMVGGARELVQETALNN